MNAKDIKHRLKTGQPVEKWQLANLIEDQEKQIADLKKSCLEEITKRVYADRSAEIMCDYWQQAEEKVKFLEDKVVMVDPQEYGFKYLYGDDLLEAQKRINNLLRNMVDDLDVRKDK